MKLRLLSCGLMVAFLYGCTTTQQPSTLNQLQIKVSQLEGKINSRDEDLDDLKTEVQNLRNQIDDVEQGFETSQPAQEFDKNASNSNAPAQINSSEDERIIRVSASPIDVQKALKNAGYYQGNLDGKFGKQSQIAVANFQKDNDLTSDGIVGQKTWSALKKFLE